MKTNTTNLGEIKKKAIKTGIGINDAKVIETRKGDIIKTTIEKGLRGKIMQSIEIDPENIAV